MNTGQAGAGMAAMVIGLLFLAALVFLIILFVAPIKLYSIHREIKITNALLQRQIELLTAIHEGSRFQGGLLATIAQAAKASAAAANQP